MAAPVWAQSEDDAPPAAVLLIMDSSGSMIASDGAGSTKIAGAKDALTQLVDQLPDGAVVGLRVYGHRIPNTDEVRGCQDTELIVPVGRLQRGLMKERIRSFDATGFTPIGLSLQEAAKDLPERGERTIVLVSDGIDTCAPPPPCLVARRISRQGIHLRIDTIGFQVNPRARRQLRCIARAGGGTYSDARSSDELGERLSRSSLRALRVFEVTGTPISGAPSAQGAPLITSGAYTDVISADEERWYRVDLAEGQSLSASITVVTTDLGSELVGLTGLIARIAPPQGGVVASGVGQHSAGEPVTARVTMGPVGSEPRLAPGSYHLYLDFRGRADFKQVPIEMVVEVVAGPGGAPSSPGGAASAPAAPEPPATRRGLSAITLAGTVIAGAVGVMVGALVAGKLVR